MEALQEGLSGNPTSRGSEEKTEDAGGSQIAAKQMDTLMDASDDTDEVNMMQQHFDWVQVVQEELLEIGGSRVLGPTRP